MEARISLKVLLFALLSVSVLVTGCSRQFYSAMVTSDDGLGKKFANLLSSSSTGDGLAPSRTQSLTNEALESKASSNAQASASQNKLPLQATLGSNASGDSASSKAGHGGSGKDLHARGSNTMTFQGLQNDANAPGSGFRGRESESVIESGQEFSSPLDGVAPLQDKDLLTEMAAASATGDFPEGSHSGAFSHGKGDGLMPLGDELFGQGTLGDVFFDFDAASIRSDAKTVLHANAELLKARFENRQIIIEGHADERGTTEYNLVLGERRAQSSKQYLVDLGVAASAIQTISYGKEKPFCSASNPNCWKMNRRGHFVLQ
jgi:peptidoglycan-associated lipoprotein